MDSLRLSQSSSESLLVSGVGVGLELSLTHAVSLTCGQVKDSLCPGIGETHYCLACHPIISPSMFAEKIYQHTVFHPGKIA